MTLRSLIASKRNFKVYLFMLSLPVYFFHSLASKDYWAMLFLSCIALFAPILWTALGLYIAYKVFGCIMDSTINHKEIVQDVVIQSVVKNNLQELEMAIESNPEILYCDYRRKSLETWCRYYKNKGAQEVIAQLKIKYPRKLSA